METQARQLEAYMSEEGWRVIEKRADNLPWWLDELWTLESYWSPQGLVVWIAFEVNPINFTYHRPKGKNVWCVTFHSQDPLLGASKGICRIDLFPHWEQNFANSKGELKALRNRLRTI